MPPDVAAVPRLISAVARRRRWHHFALSALAGTLSAVGLTAIAYFSGVAAFTSWHAGIVIALGVLVPMAWSRTLRTPHAAAHAIERARPSCRNLVITAEEMTRHPERSAARTNDRVMAHAAAAVEGLRASDVVPTAPTAAAVAVAFGLSLLLAAPVHLRMGDAVTPFTGAMPLAPARVSDVRVTIEPPQYVRASASVLTNPARIEALEGSRIRFEIPDGWRVRFGADVIRADFVSRTDGYFAIESSGDDRRLIPLNVTRDRVPAVRIDTPAKDLLLPDGSRTIPVQLSAADDLGLESLELRFTKISGSGEQFEFVEGTLPVRIERTSGREWTGEANLVLPSIRLGAGDSLVYRAVARDGRPGSAGLASSDTYFVEIAGPGQVALEGIEMPPEMERYAMSQQMIVVKLERLRNRERGMTRTAVIEEAASLAAEQRTVRANFVFLLGGHVEDEEEEAAQSHEIQEGRLENTARRDINAAVSHMTRVEQALVAVDTAGALPPARAAVESLQRAFGRSRYLLRSLASRSPLDLSRRLTGNLAGAGDWRRTVDGAEPREGEDARLLLNALLDLAARTSSGVPEHARLQELAETALSIDPAAPLWQDAARRLAEAKDLEALEQVIATVSREALRGTISRGLLSTGSSPIERAFRAQHRR